LGVVLHAGLVVRHHCSMLSGLSDSELARSLSIICYSDGPSSLAARGGSQPQKPADTGKDCPVCMGMDSGTAILPSTTGLPIAVPRKAARVVAVPKRIAHRVPGFLPPPRGPPLSA
jgi:hypothetical protein